jgi:hypothetical protein
MAAPAEAHYGDHVFIRAFPGDMRPYRLLTLPLSTEMLKTRNLMTTDAIESLARARCAAADRAFEIYDFGTTEVEGACGWQCETPGYGDAPRVFPGR